MVCGSTVQLLASSAITGDNRRGDWCEGRPLGEGERADHGEGIGSAAPPSGTDHGRGQRASPAPMATTLIHLTPEVSMKGYSEPNRAYAWPRVSAFYPLATVSIHVCLTPSPSLALAIPWRFRIGPPTRRIRTKTAALTPV